MKDKMVLRVWSDDALDVRVPAQKVVESIKKYCKPWMTPAVESYQGRPECVVTITDEDDPADAFCQQLINHGFDTTSVEFSNEFMFDQCELGLYITFATDMPDHGAFLEERARKLLQGQPFHLATEHAEKVVYNHSSVCKVTSVDWLMNYWGMSEAEAVAKVDADIPELVGENHLPKKLEVQPPNLEARVRAAERFARWGQMTPEQRRLLRPNERFMCMILGFEVAEDAPDQEYDALFHGDVD